jgi:hypothetical protein
VTGHLVCDLVQVIKGVGEWGSVGRRKGMGERHERFEDDLEIVRRNVNGIGASAMYVSAFTGSLQIYVIEDV